MRKRKGVTAKCDHSGKGASKRENARILRSRQRVKDLKAALHLKV